MEYEIESETVLFDPSTNPSLEHKWSPLPARDRRALEGRRWQKAELIPEEEQAA